MLQGDSIHEDNGHEDSKIAPVTNS